MRYFMMRPCRTTAAHFATLRQPQRLDLPDAQRMLEGAGYGVTDCGVLLIIHDDPERTLYKSGRILVKTAEEGTARQAVEEIYEVLGIAQRLTT